MKYQIIYRNLRGIPFYCLCSDKILLTPWTDNIENCLIGVIMTPVEQNLGEILFEFDNLETVKEDYPEYFI